MDDNQQSGRHLTRRGVLKAGLAAGALAGSAAWTFGRGLRQPGSLPHPARPAGTDTVPPDNIPPAVPSGQSAYDGFGRYGFRVPFAIVSPIATRTNSHRWTCSTCDDVLHGAAHTRAAGRGRRPRRARVQRERSRHDPAGRLGHQPGPPVTAAHPVGSSPRR
jgi:hypothetical protein